MTDERHDLDGSTWRWYHVVAASAAVCSVGVLLYFALQDGTQP